MRVAGGVSRDGSSSKGLKPGQPPAYGLTAKAYRYELEAVREIPVPAVIHWNFNHFVVLCGFTRKGAVINDPARGRTVVSMKEFDRAFTGVVLTLAPSAEFEKGRGAKEYLALC